MAIDYTMEKCDDLLEGVEGTPLKIIGSTTLKVTFNEQSKIVRFTILEDKDVAILGLKAMNHMKVLIETEKSLLCCNGFEQPFFQKGSKICNVKDKTYVFLANCEVIRGHKIVYGYVKGDLPSTKECILELDYASRYGLALPPVVCQTHSDIPMYIFNTLSHPLKLKKNAKMGSVSPTMIDDEDVMVMEHEGESGKEPVNDHPLGEIDLSHLSVERKKEMGDLLVRHQGLFSRSELDVGHCTVRAPKIQLKEGVVPICEPLRKYNQRQLEALSGQVEELERQKVISTSNSSWQFFPCLASKRSPTGKILAYHRFCLDLRRMNSACMDADSFSRAIPRVSNVFDALAYALKGDRSEVFYTKLNVSQAFFLDRALGE